MKKEDALQLFLLFLACFSIIRGINFAVHENTEMAVIYAMFAIIVSRLDRGVK